MALYVKMKQHLFDITVYRIPKELYSKQQNDYVKKNIPDYDADELFANVHDDKTKQKINEASYYFKDFGGGWRYNEIIGYLRIHKFGNQIRAEYWQTDAKRIVKTRKKQFIIKSAKLVPEVKIKNTASNDDIKQAIDTCIDRCNGKLSKRHLDLTDYNNLLKHVNWVDVFKNV